MRRTFLASVAILGVSGCSLGLPWNTPYGPEGTAIQPNPLFVASNDPDAVWETLVDVIGDEFRIRGEEPVRVFDGIVTEGRLDTYWQPGATAFEPWHRDSASAYDRLESTLQSTRRMVSARVIPANGGFWVEIVAAKELENIPQPAGPNVGAATFRYDNSLTRVVSPIGQQEPDSGWIDQGRDMPLEQYLIYHLQARFAGIGTPRTLSKTGPR